MMISEFINSSFVFIQIDLDQTVKMGDKGVRYSIEQRVLVVELYYTHGKNATQTAKMFNASQIMPTTMTDKTVSR